MRFAYADPPYLGCAQKLYGDPTYDSLTAHESLIRQLEQNYPDGPDDFCAWLFDVLNVQEEDTVDDLFPGTGTTTRVLEKWRSQTALEFAVHE